MVSYYRIGEVVKVFESTLHKQINCPHTPKKRICEFVKFGGTDCVRFHGSTIPHAIDCIGKTVPTCEVVVTWKNQQQRRFIVDKSDLNDSIYSFASKHGFEDEIYSYEPYKVGQHTINGKRCRAIDIYPIG